MKKIFKKVLAVLSAAAVIAGSSGITAFAQQRVAAMDTGDVTIQILATSDVHGRFLPYDYALNEPASGSLAQISTLVKELRQKNSNTILVDAGDSIQDNSADLFLNDAMHPMIEAMNLMNYDVWVTGNHEYNYGVDVLKKIISQQKAKVLVGNVYDKDGSSLADGYTIIEKGGVKVGVIGMVTPNITKWDAENLKGYKVTDPVEETKKIIKEIKDKVDVLIAVDHMSESNEYDVPHSGAIDMANACPELDLIVASHEHKAVPGKEYNNVLLVENASQGTTLAKVDITLSKKTDGSYEIKNKTSESIKTTDYEADEALVKGLASYDKKAKKDAAVVIGKLKGGNLVGESEIAGIPQSQIAESAMINLINEVQMYYTKADVSAAAAFNPDANMYEGNIKKCDTALIYKYANTLYKMEMTGAQLKKYMEWSVSYYNTYKKGDLTLSFNQDIRGYNYDMFSGITYDVNVSKEPGKRIENVRKADGTKLKDSDVLTVAVNNYRASSQLTSYGPIYQEGEKLPVLLEKDVAGNIGGVRELIGDYIKNVKKGIIKPQLANNWKITGIKWNKDKHNAVSSLVDAKLLTIPTSEDGRTPNVKSITEADLKGLATVTNKTQTIYASGKKAKTVTLKVLGDKASLKRIKYVSSNKKAATVDKKGKVTAKKDGKTLITTSITLKDGTKFKVETVVNVKKK